MRVYKTEKQDVKICTDIICDKCGRNCIGSCGNFCGIQFTVSGGYDSHKFPDDEVVRRYEVCEFCADGWMKTWPKDYLQISTTLGDEIL